MFSFVLLAFISGLLLSNQSPINARLGRGLGSPFIAASFSFTIGTIFLGIVTFIQTNTLFPSIQFISQQPAWIWLGGLLGCIYLTSNILLFPRIGAVKTVVLPILGQIIMGIAIDTFGWFGATSSTFNVLQAVGVGIMFTGILLTVTVGNNGFQSQQTTNVTTILWMIWAVIIGMVSAMQQAINGHLGTLLHSSVQAAFMSFGIGMVLIVSVTLFLTRHNYPSKDMFLKVEPWAFTGGILGALFVLTTVISVPAIGTGLTIMMALIGQVVGSILVQQFGLWKSKQTSVQLKQILGILIMVVGIVLIKFL
ncbi:DMT family transporter [Weissella tructae]|uniref:Transporter n=2 Tax=Weissella TaxID=46255 RepID=A0ABN4DGK8_9LACO|nr:MULTISPECIES: DMT family transporter [Weissella]AIG65456.1 Putative transporter [Weissella tructae]AIM62770.1 Putative transporter [Weissella ceti]AIM64105.1 Putative transporter [Weissella ceti]ELA07084.1 hypothetical protein WCNC_05872 [Weissella ceti NC36]QVV91830.1 DMT family transporter [Weissella tructae]